MAAVGSKAALSLSSLLITQFLSMTRKWVQEKADKSIENIISQQNETTDDTKTSFNEKSVAENQAISKALTKQLQEIKEGINSLRNKDFESGKSYFIEALRWRCDECKFRKYIELSYDKCIEAKSVIVESYDKIYLYSLLISAGFIYHSNYGQDYARGLKHIYNVLIDMNADKTLRTNLGSALGSKIYWSDAEKKLIRAVIYFSIRINLFIKEIQKLLILKYEKSQPMEKKVKCITHEHGMVDLLPKDVITHDDIDENKYDAEICLKDEWLPSWDNGYYFGHVSKACKYSVLSCSTRNFRKAMNIQKPEYKLIIDDVVIYTEDYCNAYEMAQNKPQNLHYWYGETGFWRINTTEKKYKIKFKTLTGHNKLCNITDSTPVGFWRKPLEDEFFEVRDIIYQGTKLQDDYTFSHYGIREGDTIFVLGASVRGS
eukprot:439428_1